MIARLLVYSQRLVSSGAVYALAVSGCLLTSCVVPGPGAMEGKGVSK